MRSYAARPCQVGLALLLAVRGALAADGTCPGREPSCRGVEAAGGEVLLLQKRYTSSLAVSSAAREEKAACHTAVEPEACYTDVIWAKTIGVVQHPEWYSGLTTGSTFEQFQAWLRDHDNSTSCPEPCEPAPAEDVRVRLSAFNVYYADLGTQERTDGIGDAIAQLNADIAVITEQWEEKPHILARIRTTSGRNYQFCSGGPQEKWWDGDILYDADLWEVVKDGVKDWGSNRGLSWALLRHKECGRRLFVYGVHPVAYGHEDIHLQNALDLAAHLQAQPEWPEAPVVVMGDFNALEDWSSTKLYETGSATAYDKYWQLPMTFVDTFRDVPANLYKDATTHDSGARLDYIFTERRAPAAFQTLSASIWYEAPGESDHFPISAEVLLKR